MLSLPPEVERLSPHVGGFKWELALRTNVNRSCGALARTKVLPGGMSRSPMFGEVQSAEHMRTHARRAGTREAQARLQRSTNVDTQHF